jgi:site-specific DNA-methyltransferase (adenine-specific)
VTPYYSHGGIQIFLGDCREVLPTLGRQDAVITDPPFGMRDKPLEVGAEAASRRRQGLNGARGGAVNTWHAESDWDKALDPAWAPACLAAAPVLAWFGHWRSRADIEGHLGMSARAEIVWAKDMHCGPPCPVARQDERIWLFSESGIVCKRFDTTVWSEPVIPTWAKKLHKNEKPIALMRRLVALLLVPGECLIDPFMGSGTTLRAAKDLGVRAIGIEIEERYAEIAAKRLAQEVLFA